MLFKNSFKPAQTDRNLSEKSSFRMNRSARLHKSIAALLIGSVLVLSVAGCSESESADNDGFTWTGQKTLQIPPLDSDVPYDEVVKISNPDLAVKADIDFSEAKQQTVPVEVYNKKTGEVVSSEDITVQIQTGLNPVIDIHFPDPAVMEAKDFILEDYVSVQGTYADDQDGYDLNLISPGDLYSGKPGYVLYDADTGEVLNSEEWQPGDYRLILVASNGYGNSAIAEFSFTLN